MRSLIALGALVTIAAVGAGSVEAQPQQFGRVSSVQMADGDRPVQAFLFDLDEDGHDELIAVVQEEGASEQRDRRLQIHAGRSGDVALEQSPRHRLRLTEDVTAIGFGDVHPDPGSEVVLFNARGAFAWRPEAEGADRFVRLCEARFLWQLSGSAGVIDWTVGTQDIDGDGQIDLLIPEPDGYRIVYQDRDDEGARFERQQFLRVSDVGGEDLGRAGDRLRGRERGRQLQLSLRTGASKGPWLQVVEGLPAPQLLDYDGDGDLDVWALTSRTLCVWPQGEKGVFPERPERSVSPVTIDRGRRFDVSFSSHALHLNGDGRGDCVFLAGDQRSDDLRTQILVFVQGLGKERAKGSPLFGERGIPQQLLVVAGIAGSPRFEDVDGDGAVDLVVTAVQPDLLEQMRSRGQGRIEAEMYLYRNRGGLLSKRPDWSRTIQVPEQGLRQGRSSITARFVADVTGDRVRDLLLRERADRVQLLMLRRRGDELSLVDRPLWTMRIDEEARLELVEREGETRLLILEPEQVHHVRWP